MKKFALIFCFLFLFTHLNAAKVKLGIDVLCEDPSIIAGKNVGLITNHTGVNSSLQSSIDIVAERANLKVIFAPEHGLKGIEYAGRDRQWSESYGKIPVHVLYGNNRRPTEKMLKGIDLLIYDIQDIGSRSYTYISTLFYAMEAAAKEKIPVLILDRPNPLGGLIVDGPMLDEHLRSFVGYINVPYCHGMTIAELAQFFNEEYKIGCKLKIISMQGWKRSMSFAQTGLTWIPTSPQIPEHDSPFYYPTTGIIGEMQLVSIGIGYTLPFKIIGAPWIDADEFAEKLNQQNFPGVQFHAFHFKPFFGRFQGKVCHGVRILVQDSTSYRPVSTQYLIIGLLKSLYPQHFKKAISSLEYKRKIFSQVSGSEEIFNIIKNETYISWPLQAVHLERRQKFMEERKKYLISSYSENTN